jgi:conjugal transfer pilus assembly protein TraU
MKPWCFANLGGLKRIAPGFNIGFKTMAATRAPSAARHRYASKWHIDWYAYPLIYWMEAADGHGSAWSRPRFDIAYVTELDPLWQDSDAHRADQPRGGAVRQSDRARSPAPPTASPRPARLPLATSCSGAPGARARCTR